jgi:hypothetical protein
MGKRLALSKARCRLTDYNFLLRRKKQSSFENLFSRQRRQEVTLHSGRVLPVTAKNAGQIAAGGKSQYIVAGGANVQVRDNFSR